MIELALVCVASYVYVALRASQQLNVARGHYARVPIVSAGMALTEALVVVSIASRGLVVAVPLWIGGTLGCWSAMALYARWAREERE